MLAQATVQGLSLSGVVSRSARWRRNATVSVRSALARIWLTSLEELEALRATLLRLLTELRAE